MIIKVLQGCHIASHGAFRARAVPAIAVHQAVTYTGEYTIQHTTNTLSKFLRIRIPAEPDHDPQEVLPDGLLGEGVDGGGPGDQSEMVRWVGHPEEPLQPRRISGLGTSTWMGKPSHWEDPSA